MKKFFNIALCAFVFSTNPLFAMENEGKHVRNSKKISQGIPYGPQPKISLYTHGKRFLNIIHALRTTNHAS